MKNSLYHISGFPIFVWSIAYFSFNINPEIHFLLILAVILIFVQIVFEKILSGKFKKSILNSIILRPDLNK